MHATRLCAAAALALVLAACGSSGKNSHTVSLSGVKRANTYTTSDQQFPAVARNNHGQSVVVWESLFQDGSGLGVYGQRFLNGERAGDEFQVNTYTTNRQSLPAVAMDDAGNFVVVWRSSQEDGDGGTIYGQRYAADGSKLGAEFQIGPGDTQYDSQSDPAVGMNASGQFVVAWSNRELSELAASAGDNGVESRVIQARVYAADGTSSLLGAFNVIPKSQTAVTRAPAVGVDAAGNFTVAWMSDGNPQGVRARRFNALGVALGAAFDVNIPHQDRGQDQPQLAMDPAGNFVIGWESFLFDNGAEDGVYLKSYDASGNAAGDERRVASPDDGLGERLSLSMNAKDQVLVVAQHGGRVYAQRASPRGNADGDAEQVSTDGAAMFGVAALDDSGNATVAWQTLGADGDGRGVYVREINFE